MTLRRQLGGLALGLVVLAGTVSGSSAQRRPAPDGVAIVDNHLVRDGRPWVPHGFYQIAFEVPPTNTHPDHPFWTVASQNYTPDEYDGMRRFGADSVRIQVAQPGLDPRSGLFDARYRDRALGAVRAARAAGLAVIISVQDEKQTGETAPAGVPNEATRRVWREIAPVFGRDRNVVYELLNEPQLPPSAPNWQQWRAAMDETIRTVREAGAVNVVVADGLGMGQDLSGAPRLDDPLGQVAYASHPYANHPFGQTPAAWDLKFGNFARTAPVIITEWGTGYYCDANTPAAALDFLGYLNRRGIGLEIGFWDWAPMGFGSAIQGFPNGTVSSFLGPDGDPLGCKAPGFGLGRIVRTWYRTGVPPATVE